jgi:inorganic pyrophosphatase
MTVTKFALSALRTIPVGTVGTAAYRMFFELHGDRISPWHHIPLHGSRGMLHFVNEIPRGTTEKMEICKTEPHNPIKQDEKKGVLRCFKYRDGKMPFNYGALPQTWEDPAHIDARTGFKGDGDPVDVVELSHEPLGRGEVCEVKPLGILAMIDQGETDWKVLAVRSDHPALSKLHNVQDIEHVFPGRLADIKDWFRMYKTAEGKGENTFALGGDACDVDLAKAVIEETHKQWNKRGHH